MARSARAAMAERTNLCKPASRDVPPERSTLTAGGCRCVCGMAVSLITGYADLSSPSVPRGGNGKPPRPVPRRLPSILTAFVAETVAAVGWCHYQHTSQYRQDQRPCRDQEGRQHVCPHRERVSPRAGLFVIGCAPASATRATPGCSAPGLPRGRCARGSYRPHRSAQVAPRPARSS
jgi:hypothetical protein